MNPGLAGAFVLAASLSAACGRQERAVVGDFFAQSRLRDKTALQKVATVAFEPHVRGIVQSFDVTKVTPEEDGTKTVSVSALVKLPDGRLANRTIVLTMSRGLITGFIDRADDPASAATPRSLPASPR